MFNAIRTAVLSACVGLAALTAMPAAHADGIYLNFGHGDPRFGIHTSDRHGRDWGRDDGRRNDWRRDGWRRSCSSDQALHKAQRMGLRRARVVDMGRHTIKVSGRKYNDRVIVTFARERGCPVLYR